MRYLFPSILFAVVLIAVICIMRKVIMKRYSVDRRNIVIFFLLAMSVLPFGVRADHDFVHMTDGSLWMFLLKLPLWIAILLVVEMGVYLVIRKTVGMKEDEGD